MLQAKHQACSGLDFNLHYSNINKPMTLAVIIPKRSGNSVFRHRIKRVVRHTFHQVLLEHPSAQPYSFIIYLKRPVTQKSQAQLILDYQKVLETINA